MKKDYIQVIKGIGTILVIIGHLVNPESFTKIFIYSFHMPLFFFLTGLTINYNYPTKIFLKKRFKSLLLPYFIFTLISIVFNLDIVKDLNYKEIFYNIFYLNGNIVWNSSLWFLPTLFFTNIIFFFIKKISRSKFDILYVILFIIIGYYFMKKSIVLPFGLHIVPISLVFLFIGHLVSKHNIINFFKDKQINHYIFLICMIFSIYLSFINGRVNMSTNQYQNYIVFFICALCGIIFILYIGLIINKDNVLELFGKYSLYMFCTQRILFKLFPILTDKYNIVFLHSSTNKIFFTILFYFILLSIIELTKKAKKNSIIS